LDQLQIAIQLRLNPVNMQRDVVASMKTTVPLDNPRNAVRIASDGLISSSDGGVSVVEL
jgi:hypothetical protein